MNIKKYKYVDTYKLKHIDQQNQLQLQSSTNIWVNKDNSMELISVMLDHT